MIKLNVSAANIAVEEKETLTEGRVGLLCRFSFTGEWDGLAKTAVFEGADSRDVILTEDTVAVPAECLAAEGYSLSVGVYGKNAAGDIVIPTVYATVGKIQRSAYPSGRETAAPTPDVVAQIQQAAANAEAMARSVREDADLGKFNGGQGPQGPAGATGPKGDPGVAGEAGGYYTPAVTQPDENTLRVAFTPSKEDMPAVAETDITLPSGGGSGGSGEDGGYYAPSVDDEGNLTWTASKTDMPAVDGSNIKGPKGDTGATGAQGPKGDTGATGAQGPAGATGPAGADGKTAYAYAVEGGYTGTEEEFAAKLAEEMPEALPNPNALTFTGAVTGSYDGSAALSVEIPSGGGEKAWTLISTVEVGADELVASIKTPTEDEMKLYSEIFCRFTSFTKTKDGEDTASTSNFRPFIDKTYGDNGRISGDVNNTIGSTSSSRVAEVYCTIKANCISGYAQNASYAISTFSALRHTFNQFQNIPQIIFNNNNAYYYCSGTKLEVWAR